MGRRKVLWAVIALVVVGAIVGGVVMSAGGSAPKVDTVTVEKDDLSVAVTASGRVEPDVKGDVYPPTQATIESLSVTDGARVKAGQILAVLDTEPLELAVDQARAGVHGAEAQVSSAQRSGSSEADRRAAAAATKAAYTAYANADRAYRDLKSAYDSTPKTVRGSMEATLNQMQTARDQAYAGYLQAKAAEGKVRSGDTRSALRAARATRDQAEAALALAQLNLKKATLVAPIDGVVIFNPVGTPTSPSGEAPKAGVGAAVGPASPVFTVVQLGSLKFTGDVDEVDIDRIRVGQKAEISLDAFTRDVFATKVSAIKANSVQTPTGGTVFPVFCGLRNTGKSILIGMKGDVTIEVSAIEDAIVIPVEALLDDNGDNYVYVVEDDVLERRDVEVGALTDTDAEVRKGLAEGDVVALPGNATLKEGMRVRTE